MKKTYIVLVQVDKSTSNISYKDIERRWEIPVTATAFSKAEAINTSHTVARAQAQIEYGTRHGSWRTSILKVDQVSPEKI